MLSHREKAAPEEAVDETCELRRELNATQQFCAEPMQHAHLKAIVPAQSVSRLLQAHKVKIPHGHLLNKRATRGEGNDVVLHAFVRTGADFLPSVG